MAGWEQHFTVTWDQAENRGKPVLQGYVNNISPYTVRAVRILVETLDGAGETTSQRVAWVPGEMKARRVSSSRFRSHPHRRIASGSSPTIVRSSTSNFR